MAKIVAVRFVSKDGRSILFVGGIRGGREELRGVLKQVEDWCSQEAVDTLVMFFSSGVGSIFEAEIRRNGRSLNIWTVVSNMGKAPILSKGSGANYEIVMMNNFMKSNTDVITELKSNLSIDSIHRDERLVGFAPMPEKMDLFLGEIENYFDQIFTNKRYILGFSKGNGVVFFRTLGTLNKAVSGRYRAICEVLEGFLGKGKLRGSVLVGVVGYWDELVSRGPSKVDDALNGAKANSVRLDEVLKVAVGLRVGVGGGGGTMQNRRHGGMAEEGDEVEVAGDGEAEVQEEEEEEEEEEGNGVARLCLFRYGGFELGLPSNLMKKLVCDEVKGGALVVLGVRDLGVSKSGVNAAWLGLEGAVVVDRSNGVLQFGEERREFGHRGEKEFFADGDFVSWIVENGCDLLGKGSDERKRWVSEVMTVQRCMAWPIREVDDDWKLVVLGRGVAGQKVRR